MLKNTINVNATIHMGSQKRIFSLDGFSEEELLSIVDELKKMWCDKWVDITIRCNTVEYISIHVECYADEIELNSIIRIEPKGEWLERQNLYVKFALDN